MSRRNTAARPAPRVLVAGGINHDVILETDADPVDDGTAEILRATSCFGGHGANGAVALARLGCGPLLLGAVGEDRAGKSLLAGLRSEGVDTARVRMVTGSTTGSAYVVNGPTQHHMMLHRGANETCSWDEAIGDAHPVDGVLAFDTTADVLRGLVSTARRAALPCVVNPGGTIVQALEQLDGDRTENVVLVCNGTEFDQAGHGLSWTSAFAAVVRTLGQDGAEIVRPVRRHVPGTPLQQPVDPTGAGDAFTAGLLRGLLAGLPLEDAVRLGNTVGALAVTGQGATAGLPRAPEAQRLVDHFTASRTGPSPVHSPNRLAG